MNKSQETQYFYSQYFSTFGTILYLSRVLNAGTITVVLNPSSITGHNLNSYLHSLHYNIFKEAKSNIMTVWHTYTKSTATCKCKKEHYSSLTRWKLVSRTGAAWSHGFRLTQFLFTASQPNKTVAKPSSSTLNTAGVFYCILSAWCDPECTVSDPDF